jgi:isoleucyl-tRNA synthetase
LDSGTGVVHQAPAFGEVDYDVLIREQSRFVGGQGPPLICAVGPDGKFTSEAPDYQGRWVKDCDREINRQLRDRGLLYHQEQYLHDYPFCWRAEEDPLIQYPRQSWFIRTTQFKDRMLANNQQINWLPEHIRSGRFGNFLETNVDWALSRERYWGTPLPIWVCEQTGQMEAIASYDELLAKPDVQGVEVWLRAKEANPDLAEDLKVHKPYIDAVTYASPFAAGARMHRVPEVIDCWYDSGAMPFAQWGYPHQGRERFERAVSRRLHQRSVGPDARLVLQPAGDQHDAVRRSGDRIARRPAASVPAPVPDVHRAGADAGRVVGERRRQAAISDRDRCPGVVQREDRPSRSARCPSSCGTTAARKRSSTSTAPMRCAGTSSPTRRPGTRSSTAKRRSRRASPSSCCGCGTCTASFVIYANIDGFDPAARIDGQVGQLTDADLAGAAGFRPLAQRGELDRWVAERTAPHGRDRDRADGRLRQLRGLQAAECFVDALSNWYVRRSRERFWAAATRIRPTSWMPTGRCTSVC